MSWFKIEILLLYNCGIGWSKFGFEFWVWVNTDKYPIFKNVFNY